MSEGELSRTPLKRPQPRIVLLRRLLHLQLPLVHLLHLVLGLRLLLLLLLLLWERVRACRASQQRHGQRRHRGSHVPVRDCPSLRLRWETPPLPREWRLLCPLAAALLVLRSLPGARRARCLPLGTSGGTPLPAPQPPSDARAATTSADGAAFAATRLRVQPAADDKATLCTKGNAHLSEPGGGGGGVWWWWVVVAVGEEAEAVVHKIEKAHTCLSRHAPVGLPDTAGV